MSEKEDFATRDLRKDIPSKELTKGQCLHCKKPDKTLCKHGFCATCQCKHYCWLD